MSERGDACWHPDRTAFAGQTVFVLGGGPSLRDFDFSRLWGRRVVAVNAAGYSAPWADVLVFHDGSFMNKHQALVDTWRGLVVTTSRYAKEIRPDRVLRIEMEARPFFKVGCHTVKRGRSSGHTAVSLAIAMGATTVVMLGFDAKVADDGRSHYHDLYSVADPKLYARDFVPAWGGWAAAAAEADVRIVNATPGSAIAEFPMVEVDEFLPEA